MKKKEKLKIGGIACTFLLACGACSSTDVVDWEPTEMKEGNEITLNVASIVKDAGTRAGTDHVLRYSALMYEGNLKKADKPVLLDRKEIIASTGTGTITFSVPVGTYSFIIIGDYISSNSTPDENGLYEDRYYDTSMKDEVIAMRSFMSYNDKKKVDFNSINNDNYDCFAKYIVVEKGENQHVEDIMLPRIVSKVRFASTTKTKADASVKSVNITKFDFYYTYSPLTGFAGVHASKEGLSFKDVALPELSNAASNEVFYFYTLASTPETYDRALGDIAFDVVYDDGSKWNVSVGGGSIKVSQNYITTVKGALLWEDVPEKGDIILNLSKDDSWEYGDEVSL